MPLWDLNLEPSTARYLFEAWAPQLPAKAGSYMWHCQKSQPNILQLSLLSILTRSFLLLSCRLLSRNECSTYSFYLDFYLLSSSSFSISLSSFTQHSPEPSSGRHEREKDIPLYQTPSSSSILALLSWNLSALSLNPNYCRCCRLCASYPFISCAQNTCFASGEKGASLELESEFEFGGSSLKQTPNLLSFLEEISSKKSFLLPLFHFDFSFTLSVTNLLFSCRK